MSTVNGKTLNEVLSSLRTYKEPPHTTNDGHKYFKTSEFIGAFDEIVGVANYNVEYTDHQYRQISTGQELFSVKCIITIIDDDGKPVLKRECYGGYVCKYAKANGNDVNLQNSLDFVCSYAFKNAAKRFGIFGLKTTEIEHSESVASENTSGSGKKSESSVMNFVTSGAFEQIRESDGRPVYKIAAHEMVNSEQCRSDVSHIIFYPNQYSKDAEKFNFYISTCSNDKQKRLRIKTKVVGEDNGIIQYVFLGFAAA